jgi:hypothetical protein
VVGASQKVKTVTVMYFDYNQNHVGGADCISLVVSISVISIADRMSHIVYNVFSCFMVFTFAFNVDTGISNFDARSTRVPVHVSLHSNICYVTHCKLFPHF